MIVICRDCGRYLYDDQTMQDVADQFPAMSRDTGCRSCAEIVRRIAERRKVSE